MKRSRSEKNLIMKAMMMAIIMMVTAITGLTGITTAKAATTTYLSDDNYSIDLSMISDWENGEYDDNGNDYENRRRMRLKESLMCQNEIVKVVINTPDVRLIVYEYQNNQLRQIRDCGNGDYLDYTNQSVRLKVVMYRTYSEKSLSVGQWMRLFMAGLKVSLNVQEIKNAPLDSGVDKDFVDIDFNNIKNYVTGDYSDINGSQITNIRRVRLNQYLPVSQDAYLISSNNNDIRFLIYEYDANMRYVKANDLGNGEILIINQTTKNIGITLYRTYSEKSLSLGQWMRLFLAGLQVGIDTNTDAAVINTSVSQRATATPTPTPTKAPTATPTPVPTKAPIATLTPIPTKAPTATPTPTAAANEVANDKVAIRKSLYQKLITGDSDAVDISKADITYAELAAIWYDIIENDGYIAYEAHSSVILQITRKPSQKVATVWLKDLDDVYGDAYVKRYNKVKAIINEVKAATQSMSTLDKVLYVNEYVVTHATYQKIGNVSYRAGGPLGEGKGVCEGYARACNLLFSQIGVRSEMAFSYSMNHAWVYVLIDGEWYHFDPTWDDTGKNINANNYRHTYFLRSDNEFNTMSSPHTDWQFYSTVTVSKSTSTRFTDWFFHDVRGRVFYQDGLWIYVDPATGNIAASKLDKSDYRVILSTESTNIYLAGLSNGILKYNENGVIKSISVK